MQTDCRAPQAGALDVARITDYMGLAEKEGEKA